MMMNNPMMQIVGMMKSGKNPQQLLMSLAKSNPQVRQAMQMMQGKSSSDLKKMAESMAAERGTTVEDIVKQLGIPIPSNR